MSSPAIITSLRAKAEATRVEALAFQSPHMRAMMLRVAQVYDAIADNYEALAKEES